MARYDQWARSREVRRLTWLCGTAHVLAEEVAAHIRAESGECVTFTAGEDAERDIWAMAAQLPADPDATRLVLVRNAHRLRRWDELVQLIGATDLRGVRLLLYSGEPDFTRLPPDAGNHRALVPHLAALQASRCGYLVCCKLPSDAGADPPQWLLEWAAQRLGTTDLQLGAYLLESHGHDLEQAAATAAKLTRISAPPTRQNIAVLAEPSVVFTESVIAGRGPEALNLAPQLTGDEVGAAIGLLGRRLDTLSALHRATSAGLNAQDTARKLGVQRNLQRQYSPVAQRYSPQRVAACRTVLAMADDAWRSGVTQGIPEVIAALWAA